MPQGWLGMGLGIYLSVGAVRAAYIGSWSRLELKFLAAETGVRTFIP